MQDHSERIKELSSLIFKCPRFDTCPRHHLPMEHVCTRKGCKDYLIPTCEECPHRHTLLSIRKVVPMLAKWLGEAWRDIRSENIEIESEWKICLVNINYCFDILGEVKKMIESRNAHELPGFTQLVDLTTEMAKENQSVAAILRNLELLDGKYHILNGNALDSDYLAKERHFRKEKWQTMGGKTKAFSQRALAFSETLAQTIEDKLKYERRIKHLQTLTANKISTLKDLLKRNAEEVSDLKIEFGAQDSRKEEEQAGIEEYLQKCENLRSVHINNKNGRILGHSWEIITTKLEYLKNLREIKLNIRAQDLKTLTVLFKKKPNSVRYIEVLHLTITDEPTLDARDVAEFCNTLQLREAYITLARDNLTKTAVRDMLRELRVHTSLTKLPMKELVLNISKNKITDQKEAMECEADFLKKCEGVKNKQITI